MEAIYNSDKQTIIAACARCGSQHLRRISMNILYKQYHYFDYRFTKSVQPQNYKLVHVVRDPYFRWRSWFYSFVWDLPREDLNIPMWTVDDANEWLKKFEIERHYNTHTGLQKVLFDINFKEKNFKSHEYVMMNDIDYYLGLSDQTRINYDGHYMREDIMDPEVVSLLKYKIVEMYQPDYNWIKSLQIWNNGVDTLTKQC
jgi:hypothetical protein